MKTDVTVVGAGIAGVVIARRLAEEKNQRVLVLERRSHIGGQCYDYRDERGILIHRYGPHIFHTNSKKVWDYLSQYTLWHDYQHRVLVYVDGRLVPMPICLETVNGLFNTNYTSLTLSQYFDSVKTCPERIENVKDAVESQVGPALYRAIFQNYTTKQWGISPESLPPEISARIPIRTNRDDRYFVDRYQAVPKDGYTRMIENILDHPNIRVMLQADYNDLRGEIECDQVYYSGPIDEFHGYRYGRLPYRCVSFKLETHDVPFYQPVAVVNYPNDYDYTRITEFKHFLPNQSDSTVIAKEFPSSEGDPSYPIPLEENKALYERYARIESPGVRFIGRLGQYRYLNMDKVVEEILAMPI